jgi:glycosyltransferase involved in cell wall biosynthesis
MPYTETQAAFEKYNCCVIIPTYNNSKTLKGVLESVLAFTENIIVVDDGSTDETKQILAAFQEIQVLHFTENKGKGIALQKGFKEAVALGFDRAITIDSDGQHFASDFPVFFKKLQENPDYLIVGARNMTGESIPGKSSIGYKISNFWFHFETGVNLPDTQSGFRLYPVRLLNKLNFFTSRYEFEIEVLVKASWEGIALGSVPIQVFYAKGKERISHFRPFTDFTRVGLLHAWLVILTVLWYFPQRFLNRIKKKTSGEIYAKPFSIPMKSRR